MHDLEHTLDERLAPPRPRRIFGRSARQEVITLSDERAVQLAGYIGYALRYHDEHAAQRSEWHTNKERQRIVTLRAALPSRQVRQSLYEAACLDILYARIGKIGEHRQAFEDSVRTSRPDIDI